MRLPSKARLIKILHGEDDEEWEYIEEEIVHQWWCAKGRTKIPVYIHFYFRHKETDEKCSLSIRGGAVAQLPTSQFKVERW